MQRVYTISKVILEGLASSEAIEDSNNTDFLLLLFQNSEPRVLHIFSFHGAVM